MDVKWRLRPLKSWPITHRVYLCLHSNYIYSYTVSLSKNSFETVEIIRIQIQQANKNYSSLHMPCLQQNLLNQRDSECLVSVHPFTTEELTETALKAWKRCFVTELKMSQPLIHPPPYCSHDYLTGSSFYCYLVTIEQSIGHVQVKNMAFSMSIVW